MRRTGGETDLVVDDEVNGSADAVALQLGEAEGLGGEPLPGDRRVAVDQDPHHLAARGVAALRLLRSHFAEDNRIDGLQVRRIGGERQMDLGAVEVAVGRRAEMILDVARALHLVRVGGMTLELGEDGDVGLAHDIREHVQPAAVGHAEHDLLDAEFAAALQNLFQRRNRSFTSIETKALGSGELDVQKALELLGLDQPLEDRALALGGEARLVADALDALLDPGFLVRVLDVHELDADRSAIGLAQNLHDFAESRRFQPEHVIEKDWPVHVGFGEAVGLRIQLGMIFLALETQRIEVSH